MSQIQEMPTAPPRPMVAPPPPPKVSADVADRAMRLMASAPSAAADLKACIARDDDAIRSTIQNEARPRRPIDYPQNPPTTLVAVAKLVERIHQYRSRLALVAPDDEMAKAPAETPAEEAHRRMIEGEGQLYVDAIHRHITQHAQALRQQVELSESRVQEELRAYQVPGRRFMPGVAPHDHSFKVITETLAYIDDRKAQLAALEADAKQAVAVQSKAVAALFAKAGGREAVAKAIRDARIMSGSWWESHPGNAAAVASSTAADSHGAALAKLGPNPTGAVADALKADQAAATKQADLLRSQVDAALKDGVLKLVDAAIAGDEPSRATIEKDVRSEPRAFPAGFGDQLRDAQFERSKLGAVIYSIMETARP